MINIIIPTINIINLLSSNSAKASSNNTNIKEHDYACNLTKFLI